VKYRTFSLFDGFGWMGAVARPPPRFENMRGIPKRKRDQIFLSGPDILVRLAGIEPTTPWFVAKYSIQLSYSREAKIITLSSCFWKVITANLAKPRRFCLCPDPTILPVFHRTRGLAPRRSSIVEGRCGFVQPQLKNAQQMLPDSCNQVRETVALTAGHSSADTACRASGKLCDPV
jgi:hypothetical protein